MSELIRCKGSIRAVEFALLLFFVGLALAVVSIFNLTDKCVVSGDDYVCSTDKAINDAYKKNIEDKLIASFVLSGIAFIVAVFATLNALRFECFKTALAGSFLSLLIIL